MPNVLPQYTARFGSGIGANQIVGVGVKIVNAMTGKTSAYLRYLVEQNVMARLPRFRIRPANPAKSHGNGNGKHRNGNGATLAFRRNGHGRKAVSK